MVFADQFYVNVYHEVWYKHQLILCLIRFGAITGESSANRKWNRHLAVPPAAPCQKFMEADDTAAAAAATRAKGPRKGTLTVSPFRTPTSWSTRLDKREFDSGPAPRAPQLKLNLRSVCLVWRDATTPASWPPSDWNFRHINYAPSSYVCWTGFLDPFRWSCEAINSLE